MMEIKHKDFVGLVSINPRQNSSCIMGSRIYEEGRTQIPTSSPTTIDPRPQDRQGLY